MPMRVTDLIMSSSASFGYWTVFLFAFVETLPIIGSFIPGQGIEVLLEAAQILKNEKIKFIMAGDGPLRGKAIGTVHQKGLKNVKLPGWVDAKNLPALIAKADVGIGIIESAMLRRFSKYIMGKKKMEKTKELLHEHIGKTLLISRFNPLTRPYAPFVAGSTDIKAMVFYPYVLLGGIAWAVFFTFMGFVFGQSYVVATHYISRFFVIAIALSVLVILTYYMVNLRRHLFTRRHWYALLLNLFSIYLFFKLVDDVVEQRLVTQFDALITSQVMLLWNPAWTKAMVFTTNIANPLVFLLLSLVLLFFLVHKQKWYYALFLVASVAGGIFWELLTKQLIQRARPENSLIAVSGPGFPSGHATAAIIFFSVLLFAYRNEFKSQVARTGFMILNIAIVLLIGFSRIYLHAHWMSDVVAGYALGILWMTLLVLIFPWIMGWKKEMSS